MSRVVVIGAGGHAKVVISTVRAAGHEVVGLFDDDLCRKGELLLGVPVLGATTLLQGSGFECGVIAIGDNRVRARVAAGLALEWVTVVHPTAYVHPSVRLGAGTVVFAQAVIQPDSVIGEHVIVNTSASVDHDCSVADFAHIAPGVRLAGNVSVGEGSLIGIGSVAIPGLRIGNRAVVGAGSVLVRNIADNTVAYGNPAREQSAPFGGAG